MEKEVRTISTNVELRDDGSEAASNIIEGYALKFDKPSNVMGFGSSFVETLDKRCLDDTDMSDVVATFNHDVSKILGRTGANLELNKDDIGLRFKLALPDTTIARDVLENIRAGILKQCSFAFDLPDNPEAENWGKSDKDGIDYERTIRSIAHLYDVSVVTTPAYDDTSVSVGSRSLERAKELDMIPLLERRKKLLKKMKISKMKQAIQD